MKKNFLGNIKLNQFSKAELEKRKLNSLKGGCDCYAICNPCITCLDMKSFLEGIEGDDEDPYEYVY